MKKLLFLFSIILCLQSTSAKAQVYHKFLNKSSWCEGVSDFTVNYNIYYQYTDTIINNLNYSKIMRTDGNNAFFVREDTIAKKVFILTDTVNAAEVILYDFSLNVGDTLYAKHGWGAGYKLIVNNIDTANTLAGPRKQFHLTDAIGQIGYTVIEGVGCFNDPFLNFIIASDPVYYLVCSSQNQTKVYDGNIYGAICYNDSTVPCDASFTYSVGLGGQVKFTNATPAYSYTWLGDYAPYGYNGYSGYTTDSSSLTITYPCNGTYTIECVASMNPFGNNVCYASVSYPYLINITNATTVSYLLQKDTTQANTWDAYPTYSQNVGYATWYWGDGTYTQGLYPSHVYVVEGTYSICVTAFSGCGDSANYCQNDSVYRLAYSTNSNMVYVNVKNPNQPTGINKVINNNLNIYPNPAQNNFTIEVFSNEKQNISVFDVNGKQVLSQTINGTTTIDANNLSAGVYYINISGGNGISNKRLVIIK